MRLQFVTFGRGIVLFVLGVAIGTGLFLNSWFSGATLRQQVYDAIAARIQAPFDLNMDQIEIDIEHGLVIRDLRVPYPAGMGEPGDAIRAEKIVITVEHEALLSGIVLITQVDVHGLTVTLRRDPAKDGLPGLPGILRPSGPDTGEKGPPPPVVRVYPGEHGSWLRLEDDGPPNQILRYPRLLRKGRPVELRCVRADIRPDEEGRHLVASFEGARLRQGTISVDHLPAQNRIAVDAELEGVSLEEEDFAALAPEFRDALPPVLARGRADVIAHTEFEITPGKLRRMEMTAKVYDLAGSFGNVFTGEEHDMPFRFRNGEATIHVLDTRLEIDDFHAEYVSPAGAVGTVAAETVLDWELGPTLPMLDVRMHARDLQGAEFDLRRMLQPEVVESLVDPFRVAGVFDLDLRVTMLPGMPEKLTLDIDYSKGTATFAGHLDPVSRRRFGFDYPLERGHGRARFESNLANSHGLYDEFRMIDIRGYRAIRDAPETGPKQVEVAVDGLLTFYSVPLEKPATHASVRVHVADLPIDERLDRAFRQSGLEIPYRGLNLEGWVRDVTIDIVMNGWVDEHPYATYTIDLADCSIRYEPFPLPIRGIHGRIVKHDRYPGAGDAEVLELRGLHGHADGGGNIWSNGVIRYPPLGKEEWDVRVTTNDLPLGPRVRQALKESAVGGSHMLELWDLLRPKGTVGALIRMGADDAEVGIQLRGDAHLEGYRDIDCPITNLNGNLSVKGADVKIERVVGRLGEATLWIAGELTETGGIDLSSSVHNLHFGPDVQTLMARLVPGSHSTLEMLRLDDESTADIALRVKRARAGAETEFDATLTKLDLQPHAGDTPVHVKGGPVHVRSDFLDAHDLRLKAGDANIFLRRARIPRSIDGHGWVILDADDLDPYRNLQKILGPGVAETLGPDIRVDLKGFRIEFNRGDQTLLLSGAIDLRRIRAAGDQPGEHLAPTGLLGLSPLTVRLPPPDSNEPVRISGVIEYDGLNLNLPIDLRDLSGELLIAEGVFDEAFSCSGAIQHGSATIFGRTIEKASLNLDFSTRFLRLQHMEADFYGGRLVGDVAVHFEDPGGFRVDLRVQDASLAEFLKDEGMSGDEYSGMINGGLQLRSPTNLVRHMRGRAELRITEGQLLKVPGLRNVLGVLGRVVPLGDRPRFKTAEIDLDIDGETFDVEQLHLSTDINDIYGFGEINVYGDLNLLIFPQVTKMIDLPRIADVPFLSAIGNAWFKNVNEIRLEGTIDSPTLRRRALPMFKKEPKAFTQSAHANYPRVVRPRVLPE